MQIKVKSLISMTEANQNFSKVARLVEEAGAAIILKNNAPRYVVVDYLEFQKEKQLENETIENVAKKYMKKHKKAFEELAK